MNTTVAGLIFKFGFRETEGGEQMGPEMKPYKILQRAPRERALVPRQFRLFHPGNLPLNKSALVVARKRRLCIICVEKKIRLAKRLWREASSLNKAAVLVVMAKGRAAHAV